MIYFSLFFEFFKIGLFAVGGGMATLPFLSKLGVNTGWFPDSLIADMVAISESTPGPIGINMATYVGYNVAGFLGGVVATLGEIIPSLIIVVLVSKSLEKFRGNKTVDDAFYGLRPAVTGLIAAAGFDVMRLAMLQVDLYEVTGQLLDLIDLKKLLFLVIVFVLIKKFQKSPILYIVGSAVVGILFNFAGAL